MRFLTIGLIVLALFAAGGGALLVKRFLDAQEQARVQAVTAAKAATRYVVVADRDVPAGTVLSPGMLRLQEWPQDALSPAFVAADKKDTKIYERITGKTMRRAIAKGTPIIETMVFKRERAGFIAGALEPGKRAVSVLVNPDTGIAGLVMPGDRVDVVLTHDIRKEVSRTQGASPVLAGNIIRFASETVVRDAGVLAVDQKIDDTDEKAKVVKTVTLEVTPKQAETVALAKTMGAISLALRSLAPEEEREETTTTSDIDISQALSRSFRATVKEPEPASTPAPAPAAAAPSEPKIRIYRGGEAGGREGRNK